MWGKAWRQLKNLYTRFRDDGGDSASAAISFFAILSLAPLSLFAIAALSYLIRDEATALNQMETAVARFLPGVGGAKAAERLLSDIGIQKQVTDLIALRGWAAAVGFVSLLWSSSRIFVNAAPALNVAFNAKETRSFLQMQGVAFGMLFVVGFLFLLSLGISALPTLLPQIPPVPWLPDLNDSILTVLALLLGMAINALIFAVLYRYLPSPEAKVTWKMALFGGGIVAVVWEFLKQIFALYLNRFGGTDSYGRVYGSLGGIIILILWIYYSSILLLYGAQIAQIYGEHHPEEPKKAAEENAARAAEKSARGETPAEIPSGGGKSEQAQRKLGDARAK